MECSTAILYGVFVSEKSFLIGIRGLVSDEHASLLAFKVCEGRVPQELTNMVEEEFKQIGREIVREMWKRYVESKRQCRIDKFSFHGRRTIGQKAVFAKLDSMGVSAMPVNNDRPSAGHIISSARAQYIHLSALRSRPGVSIQLPGGSQLSPLPPPSRIFNPLHYLTHRGGLFAACGAFISQAVFRRESIQMDRVTFSPNMPTVSAVEKVLPASACVSRLLRVENVKDAMQEWDGVALRKYVEYLELHVVPFAEDTVGDALYEPGLHIWQQIGEA